MRIQMCENFVCLKLAAQNHGRGSANELLPEPCFEHINCQICELMYNCNYCLTKNKCEYGKKRTSENRRTHKNTGRKK
jgi:hypothetical protein